MNVHGASFVARSAAITAILALAAPHAASAQQRPPSAAPSSTAAGAPTAPAPAPPPNGDASAAALKQQGDDLMDTQHYTEALDAYAAAHARSPSPALLYNMGRALQALGRYPDALDRFEEFRATAPPQLIARVPGLAARIDEVRARTATLAIACDVDGARVLVRGTSVGTTPLPKPVRLNAGPATVEIDAPRYAPHRAEIDLAGGGEVALRVALVPIDARGTLVVRAPVSGASVTLDGVPIGAAPLETRVTPGAHRVALVLAGYDPASVTAQVGAGERAVVDVPMHATEGPITTKWWFWAGAAGIVVVAGVVTTYALVTERPADRGTYPPGQVAGPLVHF